MPHQPPPQNVSIRRGFTLIELLTVIAIIVILIGILLPVIAAVRKSAFQASTQALISNLSSAIERYRSDFGAYPGPIANASFDQTTGLAIPVAGAIGSKVTTSEMLLLGLCGGWEPGGVYNNTTVGLGPMSHNTIASAARRSNAYIDIIEGSNVLKRDPGGQFPLWNTIAVPTIPVAETDTTAPEFVDAFPEPLPIIYFRANVGKIPVQAMDGTGQYNPNMFKPYKRPPSTPDSNGVSSFKGDFLMNVANDPDDFGSWDEYFRDPNLTSQPRQKDGFWLIAAGVDRRYGTKDDQSNFGGFR